MARPPMSQEELDDLWNRVRPFAEERGISREVFEMGTRIIESIETAEDAERLANFLKSQQR